MLDESGIKTLIAEMNSIKSEMRDLKTKLYALDRKKEELFREKRKVSSDVYSRIKDAQSFKEKRNSLTDVVKTTKMSREELEARVKELDAEIHKSKEEKRAILEKLGIDDPMKLKRNIKQLEFKIETEGLSFEKEKELMKVLAKMKKQFDSTKHVDEIEQKLTASFRELHILKDQLDMSRKIVQHSAKESQKHHKELIESSKEIDTLKDKEEKFEVDIGTIKNEMRSLDDALSKKGVRIDEIRKVLEENNVKLREDVERSNYEILKQKDLEVQEKLKKKQKLTTEDLLILQKTMKG